MKEIIDRGDAEEVHDYGTQGERWFIPHHGIYHPKKPENCVSCSTALQSMAAQASTNTFFQGQI